MEAHPISQIPKHIGRLVYIASFCRDATPAIYRHNGLSGRLSDLIAESGGQFAVDSCLSRSNRATDSGLCGLFTRPACASAWPTPSELSRIRDPVPWPRSILLPAFPVARLRGGQISPDSHHSKPRQEDSIAATPNVARRSGACPAALRFKDSQGLLERGPHGGAARLCACR